MDGTSKRLALLAIVCALMVGLGGYMFLSNLESMAIAKSTEEVVVATKNIPARVAITPDMVTVVRIPIGTRHQSSVRHESEVVGAFTIQPIIQGEQIITPRLFASAAQSGLSFLLNLGYRAMSIRIDEQIAVANQVRPGDFVDIIVSYDLPTQERTPASSLVLQNIRVLAVGEAVTPGATPSAAAETMTLEVTPEQAERLVWAEDYGKIRLLLRPVADHLKVTTQGITGQTIIER
ncbi:MAG: Flp pilus assembly protein CpaB [Peptococcaceae bacterium]|nr:Flp pilus assembly protein CpaB [Peptococcaceae bacterium]